MTAWKAQKPTMGIRGYESCEIKGEQVGLSE
jgi:hypothetical protein